MGKHSPSQILLSVVFKGLAELKPREDFDQKSIEMERNLCHRLILGNPFRACTSQEKGAYPISIDTKTHVQDMYICSRSEGPCLHTHSALLAVWGMRQWGIRPQPMRDEREGRCAELFVGIPLQTEQCHSTRAWCSLGVLCEKVKKVKKASGMMKGFLCRHLK